jgi:hypothetical protein
VRRVRRAGGDVVEVQFDRVVGVGVAARAEPSTVHAAGREVMADHGDERFERGVVGDRSVDYHQGRPSPSAHTAIGMPSAERTSNRLPVNSVTLLVLIRCPFLSRRKQGRRSSSGAHTTAWAKVSGC